jgi:hypothetical protein
VSALAALARYVRRPVVEAACGLCAARYADEHAHVVDLEARQIVCVCAGCAAVFRGAGEQRFRTVPRAVRRERVFTAAEAWMDLGIPVGVAFCFHASRAQRWIAVLPGAAGAIEAELDDERWARVCAASALARSLAPDVEALLVRARPGRPMEAFAAPIDRCYELAGILRQTWRGFDGGDRAHEELDAFFARLDEIAAVMS